MVLRNRYPSIECPLAVEDNEVYRETEETREHLRKAYTELLTLRKEREEALAALEEKAAEIIEIKAYVWQGAILCPCSK